MKKINKKMEEIYLASYPVVHRKLLYLGANELEAKEIFHDAMVILFTKKDLNQIQNPKNYLLGISENLFKDYLKKEKRRKEYLNQMDQLEAFEIGLEEKDIPFAKKMLKLIEKAGEKCTRILQNFYFTDLSANEIATKLGFKNGHSASEQKYKCIQKLKSFIKTKALKYEDFTS